MLGADGSGYYGGGGGSRTSEADGGGGGGSSFVSGHTGCVAIASASSQTPKNNDTTGTLNNDSSIHYSGRKFYNTLIIDGAGYNWTNQKGIYTGMPNYDGTATMVGNTGNGYAKIVFLK